MREKPEIRCGKCNKLLGKGTVKDFEIKCPRCGIFNHLRDGNPNSEPPEDLSEPYDGKLQGKSEH